MRHHVLTLTIVMSSAPSVIIASRPTRGTTPIHAASTTSSPTSASAAVSPALSYINSELPFIEHGAIVLERLLQRFLVIKLDVTESLEFIRLLVPDQTDASNLKVFKHEVYVSLNYSVRQISYERSVRGFIRDRSPTTADTTTTTVVPIPPSEMSQLKNAC